MIQLESHVLHTNYNPFIRVTSLKGLFVGPYPHVELFNHNILVCLLIPNICLCICIQIWLEIFVYVCVCVSKVKKLDIYKSTVTFFWGSMFINREQTNQKAPNPRTWRLPTNPTPTLKTYKPANKGTWTQNLTKQPILTTQPQTDRKNP